MFLERRTRRRSSSSRYLNNPLSLSSLALSHIFFPSQFSSLSNRMLLVVIHYLSPVTSPISSLLACVKIGYFSLDGVTGSCRPTPYSSSSYRSSSVSQWNAHSRLVVFHALHIGHRNTRLCPLISYRLLLCNSYRHVPAQDGLFALIIWYVAKTLYWS